LIETLFDLKTKKSARIFDTSDEEARGAEVLVLQQLNARFILTDATSVSFLLAAS